MYPSLATQAPEFRPDLDRQDTAASSPSREEDDLDLAAIREESGGEPAAASSSSWSSSTSRPQMSRQTTAQSISTTFTDDMIHATPTSNLNSNGKWQPAHRRTQQQVQRYTRRCMPILLADAPRASDVLICNGKRVKINWRMQLLEEWELKPPSYKSHGFATESTSERARSVSQGSLSASSTRRSDACEPAELLEGEGEISTAAVAVGLANLELVKVASNASSQKYGDRVAVAVKAKDQIVVRNDYQGVVCCF